MRDEPPAPDDTDPEREEQHGSLRPTSVAVLAGWAVVGLVCGWAVHPVSERLGAVPPVVSWLQPLALWLLAAILGFTAWATWRAVQVRQERLLSHQAVNRLVLARASAIVAALAAGGYAGYALSWLGDPAEMADDRAIRSLVAAAAGVAAVVAALLLERACRVRGESPDP